MTLCIKTDLTKLFILNELLSHTLPLDFNAYGLEIGHLNHAVGGLLNNSFLDFKSFGFLLILCSNLFLQIIGIASIKVIYSMIHPHKI